MHGNAGALGVVHTHQGAGVHKATSTCNGYEAHLRGTFGRVIQVHHIHGVLCGVEGGSRGRLEGASVTLYQCFNIALIQAAQGTIFVGTTAFVHLKNGTVFVAQQCPRSTEGGLSILAIGTFGLTVLSGHGRHVALEKIAEGCVARQLLSLVALAHKHFYQSIVGTSGHNGVNVVVVHTHYVGTFAVNGYTQIGGVGAQVFAFNNELGAHATTVGCEG